MRRADGPLPGDFASLWPAAVSKAGGATPVSYARMDRANIISLAVTEVQGSWYSSHVEFHLYLIIILGISRVSDFLKRIWLNNLKFWDNLVKFDWQSHPTTEEEGAATDQVV